VCVCGMYAYMRDFVHAPESKHKTNRNNHGTFFLQVCNTYQKKPHIKLYAHIHEEPKTPLILGMANN
jgi:hypothetical protein